MRIAFALVSIFVVAVSGCAPHVRLAKPPSPEASAYKRLNYYKDHRPVGQQVELRGQKGAEVVMGAKLVLANGTEITHPEDLLVAVPPASRTALAVKRIAQARAEKLPWEIGGGVVMGAGVAITLATITAGGRIDPLLGGGAGLVVMGIGLIPIVIAGNIGHEMEDARNDAFRHFDGDLQERLGVRASTQVHATDAEDDSPLKLD